MYVLRLGWSAIGPRRDERQELWRYRHASPFDVSLYCGNVNRGVAVAEGKVFMTTLNAHVIALDAETGKKIWDKPFGDVRAGESATVAPLVVKDMVIVGSSGGEFGCAATPTRSIASSGEHVWRLLHGPEARGAGVRDLARGRRGLAAGRANRWITPSYDPDLNLLYYGTGNPCPDFDGGVREGDNLFTDSGVAVDADSGENPGDFQYTPHQTCGTRLRRRGRPVRPRRARSWRLTSTSNGPLHPNRTGHGRRRVAAFVDGSTGRENNERTRDAESLPDTKGDRSTFGRAARQEIERTRATARTPISCVAVQDVGATATRGAEVQEKVPHSDGVAVASTT